MREVKGVYVATVLPDRVVLEDRGYNVIAEVKRVGDWKPLIFEGACVCQQATGWFGQRGRSPRPTVSESFWFCQDDKGERAIAEIDEEAGQVTVRSPGCQKY